VETITDSISIYIYYDRYDKKNKSDKTKKTKDPKFSGLINDYVLLRGSKIYIFNTPISEKDQKLFRNKMSSKFWKKMKRLKKRNKIHYFKVSCDKRWMDSVNKEFENDYSVLDVYHDSMKIAEGVKKTKIPDTEKNITNTKVYVRYVIFNDTFMILTRNNTLNQNGGGSTNILLDLSSELIQAKDESIFTLNLTCPKSINHDNYELKFDLKNSGNNEVIIIKNKTEEYPCSYKIKGKYIYIENPPIIEFSVGKIDSKISKIKFKIHSTNHIYSMKKN
jgi:hypothetical protein